MIDRLSQLLVEHRTIYGIISRDPTPIEIELIAQTGYHVVWIDAEHAPFNPVEVARLCRTIAHLGMVPLVRIVEPTRTHVQLLLDGGACGLVLPDVRTAAQATELVRLAKYPPVGQRGVSSTSATYDYALGDDVAKTLRQANSATHIMVQVESDEGLNNLEAICAVKGIDMVTVGPLDWAIDLGLSGPEKAAIMAEKIDAVLTKASSANKITAMAAAAREQAKGYIEKGVRILFTGVDINFKRRVFAEAVAPLRAAEQE